MDGETGKGTEGQGAPCWMGRPGREGSMGASSWTGRQRREWVVGAITDKKTMKGMELEGAPFLFLGGRPFRWGDKEDLQWRPGRAEGEQGPLRHRKTPALYPGLTFSRPLNLKFECHISKRKPPVATHSHPRPLLWTYLITSCNSCLFTLLGHWGNSEDRSYSLTQCLVLRRAQAGPNESMHK